jgi:hypothetical protein
MKKITNNNSKKTKKVSFNENTKKISFKEDYFISRAVYNRTIGEEAAK